MLYNYMIQVMRLPDAHCVSLDFSVSHGGINDVTSHIKTNCHKDIAKITSTSKSLSSFYRPQIPQNTISRDC